MNRVALLHTGSFYHLATLRDPAIVALDIADLYAPELRPGDLDAFDAVYVAVRLHPGVVSRIAPELRAMLDRSEARVYVDGENPVDWIPGTTLTRRGTNFWAWRTGEDVGRRSVNLNHPFWERLSEAAVHWHYHGVLDHPRAAVPLAHLEPVPGATQHDDPWGLGYRALEGHPNTLLYYDAETFVAELVVSTMDASYHHGSGFMPGATQLLYRMLHWLRGL